MLRRHARWRRGSKPPRASRQGGRTSGRTAQEDASGDGQRSGLLARIQEVGDLDRTRASTPSGAVPSRQWRRGADPARAGSSRSRSRATRSGSRSATASPASGARGARSGCRHAGPASRCGLRATLPSTCGSPTRASSARLSSARAAARPSTSGQTRSTSRCRSARSPTRTSRAARLGVGGSHALVGRPAPRDRAHRLSSFCQRGSNMARDQGRQKTLFSRLPGE
jgi:hypothetical protein